jgi:hypothetical protein
LFSYSRDVLLPRLGAIVKTAFAVSVLPAPCPNLLEDALKLVHLYASGDHRSTSELRSAGSSFTWWRARPAPALRGRRSGSGEAARVGQALPSVRAEERDWPCPPDAASEQASRIAVITSTLESTQKLLKVAEVAVRVPIEGQAELSEDRADVGLHDLLREPEPRSRKIFDAVGVAAVRRLEGHTMPRTIVCGVDQSDAAEAVANTARWLANRLKARLVLVHVPEEPAGKAEAVLTFVRAQFGFGSRDDVRVVDSSPVASRPGDSP